MKIDEPFVSVVLPAYNAEKTLSEAIQSIIDQTYTNWELIVINDGSTDRTECIIQDYRDERIKYYVNEGNKGLIYTLNRGLGLAKGKYIARMDADDISFPKRFEKQVRYMEEHPEVVVCGTFMEKFGSESGLCQYKVNDIEIKQSYLSHTCFGHPTVMFNRMLLEKSGVLYDNNFKNAEDAKMWLDLMPYGKFVNIPEVLLYYRISESQCTNYGQTDMRKSKRKCCEIYLKKEIGDLFFEEFSKKGVNVSLIRKLRVSIKNHQILTAMYMNMDRFDILTLLFYVFSKDYHLDPSCVKHIINRFLGRLNKII